jgi:hypothetical protein
MVLLRCQQFADTEGRAPVWPGMLARRNVGLCVKVTDSLVTDAVNEMRPGARRSAPRSACAAGQPPWRPTRALPGPPRRASC